MSETAIMRDVLVALTALPGVCVWRHNTGVGIALHGGVVRYGCPGSADIIGAYRGWPLAIECKTVLGRQSPQQCRFRDAWNRAGGLYILASSADDVLAVLP